MSFNGELPPFQILAAAIRSEIDAAEFYTNLRNKVKNAVLIEKLKFLAFEEAKHRTMLEKFFAQRFASERLEVPEESPLPSISAVLGESPTVLDLFKAALKAEETAEAFYEEAGKNTGVEDGRRLFAYLSRVERSHAAMIRSEVDLLTEYPDSYNVEDFHVGQDLFHVGP